MIKFGSFFPYLYDGLTGQGAVGGIYIALNLIATCRTWLTLKMFFLPKEERDGFLNRSHVLSELTVNLPVVFGVMGTLIGVSNAVAAEFGDSQSLNHSTEFFVKAFSSSFSIAITTTIAGGLVHAYCFLLSSLDHWVATKGFDYDRNSEESQLWNEED